jgi:peptide chain release factor subunit 3
MFAKNGSLMIARIMVDSTIAVETFKSVPQLGRFTLRDEGKTIAIGKVMKLVKSKGEAVPADEPDI